MNVTANNYSDKTHEKAWLDWAFRFASAIKVDPHLSDRSQEQYDVLKTYLKRNMIDEIKRRAKDVQNYRRPLIYADLALHYARNGEVRKGYTWLQAARTHRGQISGYHKAWQKGRVTKRLNTVEVLLEEKGLSLEQKMDVESVYARLELLGNTTTAEELDSVIKALDRIGETKQWEIKYEVAATYTKLLESVTDGITSEQWKRLKKSFEKTSEKLPYLKAFESQVRLCRAAFQTGRPEWGNEILKVMIDSFDGRDLNPQFDIEALVEAAEICDLHADAKDKAGALLDRAMKLIRASEMQFLNRVAATAALARGYSIHGEQSIAMRYLNTSLTHAQMQVNDRPRAMAFARICMAMADADISVTTHLRKVLTQQLNRLNNES